MKDYPTRSKVPTTVNLDKELVAALDIERGENPRSVLVNRMLWDVAIERGYVTKDGAKA